MNGRRIACGAILVGGTLCGSAALGALNNPLATCRALAALYARAPEQFAESDRAALQGCAATGISELVPVGAPLSPAAQPTPALDPVPLTLPAAPVVPEPPMGDGPPTVR